MKCPKILCIIWMGEICTNLSFIWSSSKCHVPFTFSQSWNKLQIKKQAC